MAFSRKQQTSQGAYGGRPFNKAAPPQQASGWGSPMNRQQPNWGQQGKSPQQNQQQQQQQWAAARQASRKQPPAQVPAQRSPQLSKAPANSGQDQSHGGKVQVTLSGLPNTLCTSFMLEAMLEQAGIESDALLEVKVLPGEPCGGASISFATYQDAVRCARHFDGCQWAGARVTTTIHSAQESGADTGMQQQTATSTKTNENAQQQKHQPQPQANLPMQQRQAPQQSPPQSPPLQAQPRAIGVIMAPGIPIIFSGNAGTGTPQQQVPSKANSDDGASTYTPVTNGSNQEGEDGAEDDLWEVCTDDGFEDNRYNRVRSMGSMDSKCGTPPSEISTAFGSPACSFGSPPITPMMHCLTPMGSPTSPFWTGEGLGDCDGEEAKRRSLPGPASPLGAAILQPLPASVIGPYPSEMMSMIACQWAPANTAPTE